MAIIVRDSLYIDGAWVSPSGPDTLDIIDSAAEGAVGTIPAGTPADMDRAVEAASRAFPGGRPMGQGAWGFLQKMAEGLQPKPARLPT